MIDYVNLNDYFVPTVLGIYGNRPALILKGSTFARFDNLSNVGSAVLNRDFSVSVAIWEFSDIENLSRPMTSENLT